MILIAPPLGELTFVKMGHLKRTIINSLALAVLTEPQVMKNGFALMSRLILKCAKRVSVILTNKKSSPLYCGEVPGRIVSKICSIFAQNPLDIITYMCYNNYCQEGKEVEPLEQK
jgi:hypothetical protein